MTLRDELRRHQTGLVAIQIHEWLTIFVLCEHECLYEVALDSKILNKQVVQIAKIKPDGFYKEIPLLILYKEIE